MVLFLCTSDLFVVHLPFSRWAKFYYCLYMNFYRCWLTWLGYFDWIRDYLSLIFLLSDILLAEIFKLLAMGPRITAATFMREDYFWENFIIWTVRVPTHALNPENILCATQITCEEKQVPLIPWYICVSKIHEATAISQMKLYCTDILSFSVFINSFHDEIISSCTYFSPTDEHYYLPIHHQFISE